MMHEYRPYPQPYRPSLRARWNARFSDAWTAIYGGFWSWFLDDLDWRRIDRAASRFFTFVLTAVAIYIGCLVMYAAAIIVLIGWGVWPLW